MSKKEEVLAYLKEHVDKGINPYNGLEVCSDDLKHRYSIECKDQCASHRIIIHDGPIRQSNGFEIELAARILKLNKPKAAEIQWEDRSENPDPEIDYAGRKEFISECGYYTVRFDDEAGKWRAIYEEGDYHREIVFGSYDTLDAAKAACQTHKQEKLEELL